MTREERLVMRGMIALALAAMAILVVAAVFGGGVEFG